jgi:putative ABC transport system permease protein
MWLLAVKAMLADRGKLVTCLLGVTFAVGLVNLQGGLFLGLIHKASLLVDYGQADIWVGHRHMNNVEICTFIPERWRYRIRAVAGVERADAYLVAFSRAKMPDGSFETVFLVGSEASSLLGHATVMAQGSAGALREPDAVLVDRSDLAKLDNVRIGDIREINGRRARIVGLTEGMVGFTTSPYVFTTLERIRNHFGTLGVPPEHCSYFLVKVRPEADVATVVAAIRQRVPELDVLDRRAYALVCMMYWLTRTGIGISFGLATFLGVLVGLAVVAQTLYASVTERTKEFGTLKAIGADDQCIAHFIVVQALGSALFGSTLGLVLALLLGQFLSTPRAPVELTIGVAACSVVLMVQVCLLAAWLPYWRIRLIDPASVLRT